MSIRATPERFAVAFSLAGERREVVLPIAEAVEEMVGTPSVFYDDWFEYLVAGTDADVLLQQLYGSSELVVVCVCGEYGRKPWPRAEFRAIRARLLQTVDMAERFGILPIRVGPGDVEGILFNDVVPDVRNRTPANAAELIVARLNLVRASTGSSAPIDGCSNQALSGWPSSPANLAWPLADQLMARNAFAELMWSASPARVLLLRGSPGTGKSRITTQMLLSASSVSGVGCARFDFKGTTSLDLEVEAFSLALDIEPPSSGTLSSRLNRILLELRERALPVVLIFDSFESAGELQTWLSKVLLPRLCTENWLRVVVTGQVVPERRGSTWESVAVTSALVGLPEIEDWLEYGRANRGKEVTYEFVAQAYSLAKGSAMLLSGLLGPRV